MRLVLQLGAILCKPETRCRCPTRAVTRKFVTRVQSQRHSRKPPKQWKTLSHGISYVAFLTCNGLCLSLLVTGSGRCRPDDASNIYLGLKRRDASQTLIHRFVTRKGFPFGMWWALMSRGCRKLTRGKKYIETWVTNTQLPP